MAKIAIAGMLLGLATIGAGCGPIEHLRTQAFYEKRLLDGRIPILAHASVSDEALLLAREELERLLAHAPVLRERLEGAGLELHLVGLKQFTSDLPEHRDQRGTKLDTGELFDWHMIGGHLVGRFSSCTEATLIGVVGHRLFGTDVCMHELAHAIEGRAVDERMREEISRRYDVSMAEGHWKGQYAAKNPHEWFAEVTRYYFHLDPLVEFYDPQLANGRQWLCGYDPGACAFVRDLYEGKIDPGPAPEVLALRPGGDEATLRSGRSKHAVHLIVRNLTGAPIRVVWLDFDGRRDLRDLATVVTPPQAERDLPTFATHAWVVTDLEARPLCTFVAPESDARAIVTRACE